MAAYVVLTPPHADDEADTVFVKDGFTWLAFVIPVLWFAFHRMWLWAAAFLLVGFGLSMAAGHTGWRGTALTLEILVNLWAGLEAGALRIGDLKRRGWREADVVVAMDRSTAEAIHFANAGPAEAPARPAAPPMAASARGPKPGDSGPLLGLFDHGDR